MTTALKLGLLSRPVAYRVDRPFYYSLVAFGPGFLLLRPNEILSFFA